MAVYMFVFGLKYVATCVKATNYICSTFSIQICLINTYIAVIYASWGYYCFTHGWEVNDYTFEQSMHLVCREFLQFHTMLLILMKRMECMLKWMYWMA